MAWQKEADLTAHNSFGFKAIAEHYTQVQTVEELESALGDVEANNWPLLVLGGGSNLVLRDRIPGAVISVGITGVKVLADDGDQAIVEVGAGENWHSFIGRLLEMGLHGLENLALIPGSVGAAPVQNIGAYGVELKDCFHSLTAYDRKNKELVQINREECQFGYRDSIFKSAEHGRYIIWSVRFSLTSTFTPQLAYRGLADVLGAKGIDQPTALDVYTAVCDIRSSKLPVPSVIGNAGSFFENPVISNAQFDTLKAKFSNIVGYPEGDEHHKVAAGWLIDQLGWKGYKGDGVGVYDKQALVLVNLGDGDANRLLSLASDIKASVKLQYGIDLHIEPRIYPC